MQLYHGFKDEVETHGNAEMKEALLAIMLEVVRDKPSLTMAQYDNGPDGLFSKFLSTKEKDDAEAA